MAKTTPFARRSTSLACPLAAACALTGHVAVAAALAAPDQAPRPTTTLDRIIGADRITLGYRADAAPMSHRAASGQPEGYSVALCKRVADVLKRTLARPSLAVEWVPVSSGFNDLTNGRVDLISGAGGSPWRIGRVRRSRYRSSPAASRRSSAPMPIPRCRMHWRSDRGRVCAAVARYAAADPRASDVLGARRLRHDGSAQGAHRRATSHGERRAGARLRCRHRRRARAPVGRAVRRPRKAPSGGATPPGRKRSARADAALHVRLTGARDTRNDDDFRLAVDRALSEVYADPAFGALYTDNFGVPDTDTVAFFRNVGVPADVPIREPQ